MSEGKLFKQFELLLNDQLKITPNIGFTKFLDVMIKARTEFNEWFNRMPEKVDVLWYDTQGENQPDHERYYVNQDEFDVAYEEWLQEVIDIIKKWFGEVEQK